MWGHDKEILEQLKLIYLELRWVRKQEEEILRLLKRLVPPSATSLSLTYTLRGGSQIMGAPVAANVGQVFDPTVVESNPTTPSIPPIGPLVYASDTPAVVSVDAGTGVATCLTAGTANVSVVDQGNSLTDSVAFTVTAVTPPPPVATTLTLSYAPVPMVRRR